jgi:hypothetical protein
VTGTDKPTEQGALLAVLARLPAAAASIAEIRTLLFEAELVAQAAGRPTDEVRRLGQELDAIRALLEETMPEVVEKLVEAESASRG